MPRPRFQKAEDQKRQVLLRAAAAEFSRYGYDGASLNRIIEAAGLTKGGFYYWFDDKADLAGTLLEDAVSRSLAHFEGIEPPSDAESFWQALDAFARSSLEQLRHQPEELDLLFKLGATALRDPELGVHLKAIKARAQKVPADFFRLGQKLGAVRTDLPAPVLVALTQSLKETLVRAFVPSPEVGDDALVERITALTLELSRRILEPSPATKKPRRKPHA